MHLQKLLKEHNHELTKGAFVMATQNEDLAILKLLVDHATVRSLFDKMNFHEIRRTLMLKIE